MTKWTLPMEGGCRCNKVRLRIDAAPLLSLACHCTGCQRMSASAFSLSLAVPAEGFQVTAGEPVLGGLKRDQHYFCPHCLSWMFTRPIGFDWFVNVRAPVLDDHGWYAPFVETWTSEKLPWARTGAQHSYERLPEMSDFEMLMRAFAGHGSNQ